MSENLRSLQGMEYIIKANLEKELREGRILAPFACPPVCSLRVSSLGIVTKKAPEEYRLIHHLSHPLGQSVNDDILEQLCSVR